MFDVQSYHCFGKAEFHMSGLIFSTLNHTTYLFVSQHDLDGFPRSFIQQFISLPGPVNIKAMGDKISRLNATDHLPGDIQTPVF